MDTVSSVVYALASTVFLAIVVTLAFFPDSKFTRKVIKFLKKKGFAAIFSNDESFKVCD